MNTMREEGNFSCQQTRDYYTYMKLAQQYNAMKAKNRTNLNPVKNEKLYRLEQKAKQWIHVLANKDMDLHN